ncbi:type VI secretion system membrane subunit TssM [Pseudovibrio axinellae]|nr:type VI secretion system membrane subunit TssM [Pseudovibrio axinellae]
MKFIKTIKSYLFLSSLIFIVIALLILIYGNYIKIYTYKPFESVNMRLIGVIILTLFWGINNLVYIFFNKKSKKTSKLKEVEQVKIEPNTIRLNNFEHGFIQAMKTISENWSGLDNKRRKNSLYSLPWYVMLGSPNSGKTSFIVESQLKFPLAHLFAQENAKRIQATQDVDYWVTDEAVLFDVAGQFIEHVNGKNTDGKDTLHKDLWAKLLKLLRETRPRRPINGVVLCLDVSELIGLDSNERAEKASLIHARLSEMTEVLGTRYTVHVILTKLDLIDGFHEFIAGLPAAERAKPFGFAFDLQTDWDQSKWLDEFNSGYSAFLEKLNAQTVDRIPEMHSSQERRNLYLFTRQLAGLNTILSDFLETALHQDKFSTAPHVRGVFFSSCRQEAIPCNPVLLATSQKYEISPPVLRLHSGPTKQYFSSELFKKVIFKEAGLAGDNIKIERAKRFALVGSGLAASLVYLGFVSLYWLAYDDNQAKSQEVLEIAKTFEGLLQEGPSSNLNASGQSYIEPLAALTSANSIFGDYRDRSWLGSNLLLYQGPKIGPEIEATYMEMLGNYFLPEVAGYIRSEISKLGKSDKSRDNNERLEALRIYLMLGDAARRNPALVRSWMKQKWQEQFEGDLELQQALENHLTFAIETALLETELDDKLVKASQHDLREVPRDLRLYRNIEQVSDRQLVSPVNFRNDIGPAYNIVFNGTQAAQADDGPIAVKEFFTKDAFLTFFIKMSKSLSVVAVEDAWVANERETVEYSDADLEEFRRKVVARYATNYIASWNNALNQLEVTDFRNLNQAVDVLEILTGPDEPLRRLINRVKKETEIYEGKLIELNAEQAVNAALPFDLNKEQGLRVRRAFSQLNSLVEAKEGEKAYLEDLETALVNLYEYLKEVRQAGDRSGEMALERAKARINLQGDDPIYTIKRLGVDLPAPLNRFFAKLADQSWKVLLLEAKSDLQRSWNEEVYADYNLNYAPLYPFNKHAEQEIPLEEFEAFFGPGGKIESFYKKNLIVFVDEATGEPRQIDGRHLAIEKEFQDKLKAILDLRKQYFNPDGLIGVEYNIQPVSLSGKLRRAVMNIEGQIISYSHGPRRPIRVIWPNVLTKEAESELTVFPSGKSRPHTVTFKGPWSGFRLLDHATIKGFDGNATLVEFSFAGQKVTYSLLHKGQTTLTRKQPLTDLILPAKM